MTEEVDKGSGFPVDLVYLWCDDSDPVWREKKCRYDASSLPEDEAGTCRYRSNDELRYSLRSVWKNAPWIHHIFIVTDGQRPAWLGEDGRVTVVDHKDILPESCLPLFNSTAIETALSLIPDLSEHFLFANDDMFLTCLVGTEAFFLRDGRAVVRKKRQKLRHAKGLYQSKILLGQEEIARRFGHRPRLAPHHNIDAYLKSDYQACIDYYADWVGRTRAQRFRGQGGFPRSLVGDYMLCTGHATLERYSRYAGCRSLGERVRCFITGHYKANSRCLPLHTEDFLKDMRKYNPLFLALNDDSRTTESDRLRARRFMQAMWPEPSPFEREENAAK